MLHNVISALQNCLVKIFYRTVYDICYFPLKTKIFVYLQVQKYNWIKPYYWQWNLVQTFWKYCYQTNLSFPFSYKSLRFTWKIEEKYPVPWYLTKKQVAVSNCIYKPKILFQSIKSSFMIGVLVVTYKRIMTFPFPGMENFPSLAQKTLFPKNEKLFVPGIQNFCLWYGIFFENVKRYSTLK